MCSLFLVSCQPVCVNRQETVFKESYAYLLDYVGSPCSWDNAVMERFFLNLKTERVWQKDYANHAEATQDVADYIVNFYNAQRLHSTLGNLSPIAFEHQPAIKKPIEVSEKT